MQAFFDESERPNGTFCVAGFAFSSEQARKFRREWKKLFDPYGGFHMNEFAHARGRFKGVAPETRHTLMVSAVQLINRRICAGVAVSCRLEEMRQLSPTWLRGFGHAYSVCCHWAMCALILRLDDLNNHDRKIAYFFEAGNPHEAEAREFVRSFSASPELRKYFRYYRDSFIPNSYAVQFQAADLFAWEWAKFYDETLTAKKRHMRKSLMSILAHDTKKFQLAHLGGEKLKVAMAQYAVIGLEQIAEDAQDKTWTSDHSSRD